MQSKCNVSNIKQRDTSLDIICGVLIIHMIEGHILGNFNTLSNLPWHVWLSRILFFFMPWFFFKNGMFFHPADNWREFLARDARRYLRPFVIWSVIGECVRLVDVALSEQAGSWQWYAASIKTLFLNGQMVGNGPLWFLSALFLARVMFNVLVRHARLAPFALLACALVAASFWWFNLNLVLFVPHVFAGLFYFGCGFYLRERQRSGHSIALAGVALFVLTLISPSCIDMYSNIVTDGNLYLSPWRGPLRPSSW